MRYSSVKYSTLNESKMSSFVVFLLLLPIWSVPTGDGLNLNHSNHTKQDDLLKSEDDSQFAKLEDLIGTFSKKALDLSQCYNPKIGEKQVNIFTTKFSEVLQHYQVCLFRIMYIAKSTCYFEPNFSPVYRKLIPICLKLPTLIVEFKYLQRTFTI